MLPVVDLSGHCFLLENSAAVKIWLKRANSPIQNPAGLCQSSYPGRGPLRTRRRGEVYLSLYRGGVMYRGLYIGKYPPPPGGGEYQPMTFGGKNMKRRREKGENVKEKGRKGKKMRKREVKG